jgi:nitrous oxidase accessory protein NosD
VSPEIARTLAPYNGNLVINTPGAVIQGLDIRGSVTINAPNVTLQNCRVTSGDFAAVRIKDGVSGVIVQDCEIDALGQGQGIHGGGTILRNNIHDAVDGIDLTISNTLIQDNYIHEMRGPPR